MQNDERLFLKCFDSKDGVGQRVLHTALVDPRTPEVQLGERVSRLGRWFMGNGLGVYQCHHLC